MTDVTSVKLQRFQEAENKRASFAMKKLSTENQKDYNKQVKAYESMIGRMKGEYEAKVKTLENELERKLVGMRNTHSRKIKEENHRLNEELTNLRKAHDAQVGEIKETQSNEITELVASHKDTLENARQKYISEKSKWELS